MARKIIMPKLGMSMTEGKVIEWLVEEGERVEEGQIILRIESDKIEYEIEAPCTGILAKILISPSEEPVPVGQTLAFIVQEGEELRAEELTEQMVTVVDAIPGEVPDTGPEPPPAVAADTAPRDKIKASPAAKKLARERGIDLTLVKGSGPGGRITREDVEAYCQQSIPKQVPQAEQPGLGASVPLSRRRKTIAQRLTGSYCSVPHIYLFVDIDATEMMGLKERLSPSIKEKTGKEVSYNDILIKIVAMAIEHAPLFNSTLEGECIKIHPQVNIGLAVAASEGLIVPVIKDVTRKSLADIVVERTELVRRALDNKLEFNDIEGGTFTISNLGMYGIDYFTAIINPPQTGILSVGRIAQRPWVIDGELSIRPVMTLGLAADHRIIDGALAASFLQDIKSRLERPPVEL